VGVRSGLARRTAQLVLGDGMRAIASVLVPVVLVLAWIQRSTPPPEIRRSVLELDAPARALALVLVTIAIAVASAPAVRVVLASARLGLVRSLPVSAGWWQRTHALHLVIVNAPFWAVLGYGIAPIAAEDALAGFALAIAGVGVLVAVQVAIVAMADRSLLVRTASVSIFAGIVALAWASGSPEVAALVGVGAGTVAVVRMGRPWPEPRSRAAQQLRLRTPALAWARLLLVVWRRRAANHLAFVLGLQIAALAMVALASMRDVAEGAWNPLLHGVVVAGSLVGASAVLVAVRAVDRDRWWFDATPLRSVDEHLGRALVGLVGAAPSLVLGTVIALGAGAPLASVLAPVVTSVWAVVATLDVLAGREHARVLQAPAWRRFVVVIVLGELLALVVGVAALVPWIAIAAVRAPRRLALADAVRRRFELATKEDDHG
jgi:hypothetical protein